MSMPKRRFDVDPATPVGDVAELFESDEEEISFRVGRHLFVLHKSEQESPPPTEESETATARLLAHAGAWKGNVDGEAFKRYIAEMRQIDRDRPAPEF
jgi:hypothetical protein